MNSTSDLLKTCQNFSTDDGRENLTSSDINCEHSSPFENRSDIIPTRKKDLASPDEVIHKKSLKSNNPQQGFFHQNFFIANFIRNFSVKTFQISPDYFDILGIDTTTFY